MMRIRQCDKCKRYTLHKTCSVCKLPTIVAKPQKYSPEDRYGELRRQAKAEDNSQDK